MSATQVGGIDGAEMLTEGGLDHAGVDQIGDPLQQTMLLDHVCGLVQRTGEHQLPVQRQALALELHHIQRLQRVVDQRQTPLRRQALDQLRVVLVGLGQAGDMGDLADANARQFLAQRLAVIDHMMCAQITDPGLGFRARGSADHGQAGQVARQLGENRTDATGGADDQQALALIGRALGNLQAFEQQFPGGDGGQRQGCSFGERQAARHMANDAFIDQVQFAIGAGTVDGAGIEHPVAGLEQSDFAAHGLDDAGRVPAQYLGRAVLRFDAEADLGIDRVDRDGPNLDQKIVCTRSGFGQLHVLQCFGMVGRQGLVVSDGFHGNGPL